MEWCFFLSFLCVYVCMMWWNRGSITAPLMVLKVDVRATGLFQLLVSGKCGIRADGWIWYSSSQPTGELKCSFPHFSVIPGVFCGGDGEELNRNCSAKEFCGLKRISKKRKWIFFRNRFLRGILTKITQILLNFH